MKRVAVILSGCGVKDGSEIHEAVATLLSLDRAGAQAVICAPAGPQHDVVNHLTGQSSTDESRTMLVEAARIARGAIRDLAQLDLDDIDAVILPGGFGAAKNLCTFALAGKDCVAHPAVADFLRRAHGAGKPIGAICIAPAVVVRVLGADAPVRVTIGNDQGTAAALNAMGAQHVDAEVRAIVVDEKHKLVTTPAYMLAQRISEVFDGIDALVRKVVALC